MVAELNGSKIKQRVVFLVPRYTFESVSFICYQYVSELRKHGIDAHIASLRNASLPKDPVLNKLLWQLPSCDILITHLFLPDLVGFLLSRLIPSIKWVPFIHCDIVGGLAAERRPFTKFKAWLWKSIIYRAELVISPSQYALRCLPNVKNVVIVPHCIDPEVEAVFRDMAIGKSKESDGSQVELDNETTPCYVFIGRDTRGKRLSSLLRLVANNKMLKLRVIGKVNYSKIILEQLSSLDLTRCEFLGHRFDPYRYVRQGDVVVCPSGREGFGLVPLECIARNIPVAVINEGVFRELYGGTSMVYDRLTDIPDMTGELTKDMRPIREKFIGRTALAVRIELLMAILIK